jgi:signal transduction histidine kinase
MSRHQDLTIPGLVHDLNNVFQTLVDVADLLAADPRSARLSSAILRSVERGRRISASLASGGGRSAAFDVILANAVAFVEDFLLARNGRHPRVEFASAVDSGIELRHGWAWERVLINLFLNALRAMPEGGAIRVEARKKDGGVEIAVRDSGSGVSPRLLRRLFEPRVSGRGSSGLGLHIVRTIVRQDGGTVRAANLKDGGAEFVMALPSAALVVRRARAAGRA